MGPVGYRGPCSANQSEIVEFFACPPLLQPVTFELLKRRVEWTLCLSDLTEPIGDACPETAHGINFAFSFRAAH